jgi:hypothetical protein
MSWLPYIYWIFYGAFLVRPLRLCVTGTRWEAARQLNSAPQHDGTPQPKGKLFHANPAEHGQLGKTLSAHSTLSAGHFVLSPEFAGATVAGFFFGCLGIWLCGFELLWQQALVIAPCVVAGVAHAWFGARRCAWTVVGSDGFLVATGKAAPSARKVWTYEIHSFPFVDLRMYPDPTNPDLTYLAVRNEFDREELTQLERPPFVPAEQWHSFVGAAYAAYLDYQWSHSLLRLAVIAQKESEATFKLRHCLGVMFWMLFPSQANGKVKMPVLREDNGRVVPTQNDFILFCLKHLHYRRFRINDYAQDRLSRNAAVDAENYVDSFAVPATEIQSIEIDSHELIIITDDHTVRHSIVEVPDAPLLVRLYESGIWEAGIAPAIEKEMRSDVEALRRFGWSGADDEEPFWNVIGGHRRAVWKAAGLLEIPFVDEALGEGICCSDGSDEPATFADWAQVIDETKLAFTKAELGITES